MARPALVVHAARLNSGDPDRLDITRQNADAFGVTFAPSWHLLRPFLTKRKTGELTDLDWVAYVTAYTAEMRASYRAHRARWEALLARPRVVLVCFCPDPERCHRTVLGRDILTKLGATWAGELLG